MPTMSEIFVLEVELGFGFLGGLFMHVGIDPDAGVIMGFLKSILPISDLLLILLIFLIGMAASAVGILGIFADTGKFGLFVVWSAWVSGLIIPIGGATAVVGMFLLVGAILLGPVAYDIQNN
jgi:hypothetical protein